MDGRICGAGKAAEETLFSLARDQKIGENIRVAGDFSKTAGGGAGKQRREGIREKRNYSLRPLTDTEGW